MAGIADKLCIIRSICHRDPNHGGGNHYMMTGAPTPMPVNCGASATFHPSLGSMVSYARGTREGVPAYVAMPKQTRSGGPNFLGAKHAPFAIDGDPNRKGFKVRDVVLPPGISEGRAKTRRELRTALDRMARIADAAAEDPTLGFDTYYKQATSLVASPRVQTAFDISQESDEIRDRYGRNNVGQRLLLCRRLIEVGVSFITYQFGGWDHHTVIFDGLKKKVPPLDQGLTALITDLEERGMLETTLVILLGEFGRTPKINDRGGRDHWASLCTLAFVGGGLNMGQVIGRSARNADVPNSEPITPQNLMATLMHTLFDVPTLRLQRGLPRQIAALIETGQPIPELF